MWQQSNVDLLQHPRVKSECGQGSSEAVRVVQCIPQLSPAQKLGPYPFPYKELGHLKSQNPKETTIGTFNQLEYPARRDLTEMVSHARQDATEILFDQTKITA